MTQTPREQLKVVAERAILVSVVLRKRGNTVDPERSLAELQALTETAGAAVVGMLTQKRSRPAASTYLGKGKVQELVELVKLLDATLVVFNNDLSPSQIRNIEEEVCCKVIDRSELILDIFANRATTHAAKLQVEIAQLEYTYPRLRAMWDHLGQIVGGAPIGIGTRGPGEQQLEIDRRLVQRKLKQLKREVESIQARKTREVSNRNLDHFTVGLVGYTNSGKSTLFNYVTSGGAFAHQKLFATLSTRIERWDLGGGNAVLLSDTVGFIRNLPHHLIASFRSTLEETIAANLLLVLLDTSDPDVSMQCDTVIETLNSIGAVNQQRLIILNKIDQLDQRDSVLEDLLAEHPQAFPISAVLGSGIDQLTARVLKEMLGPVREVIVNVPLTDARAIDFLENRAEVKERTYSDGRVTLTVSLGRLHVEQLLARGAQIEINGLHPADALRELWDEGSTAQPVQVVPPHIRFSA